MAETTHEAIATELLPEATRRLIRTVDAMPDPEYAAPSGCAGWARSHVIAHLALNAEGLAGALRGIVEGEPVPMYASQERRDTDIDTLGGAAPPILRDRLLGACTDLAEAIAALPADEEDAAIERVPGGPTFAAGAVPEMRLREVEIHHADLGAGYTHADWSPWFVERLLDGRSDRGPVGSFTVHATDLDRTWTFGEGGPTVSGRACDLAWWLTGRGDGAGLTSDSGSLPQIGGW